MSAKRRWLSDGVSTDRVSTDIHVGRKTTDIDQNIGRVSINKSVECRPTCRPTYRPTDAFSIQDYLAVNIFAVLEEVRTKTAKGGKRPAEALLPEVGGFNINLF